MMRKKQMLQSLHKQKIYCCKAMDLGEFLDADTFQFCSTQNDSLTGSDINALFSMCYESSQEQESIRAEHEQLPNEPGPSTITDQPLTLSRFAAPVTKEEILEHRMNAVPKRTNEDTKYCCKVWQDWCKDLVLNYQYQIPSSLENITNHQFQQ